MDEEKKTYKELKSARVTVNGQRVHQSDCTIGPGYVNMSWDNYESHFSLMEFEHSAPRVSGDKQISLRFCGT